MTLRQPTRPVRIGLFGMYGSANLGDVAIQRAVIDALRARCPGIELTAICPDPEDAVETFGLPARAATGFGGLVRPDGPAPAGAWLDRFERSRPWLRLSAAAWRIRGHVRDLDMLLFSGSGQIEDYWGGAWGQPFRLLAWGAATRSRGKAVAYFGVGVDQLLTPAGARMSRSALRLARLRVLRDEGSVEAMRRAGLAGPCSVCPDPAFALRSAAIDEPRPAQDEVPFAVLSPIARSAWPGPEDASYENYLRALAGAADHLQGRGIEVRWACSQTRMDPPVVERVRALMRGDAASTLVVDVRDVDDYLRAVRGARVIVASRLHGVILALVAGTPVVAISVARKVRQQMDDAALPDACLEFDGLQACELRARIDDVLEHGPAWRLRVVRTRDRLRHELDSHFDRLAAVVPHT
ncbi:MAG: polysaccharide pyruvyl transferase family protein [Rubrivivax sp.]|nr:polysaccharide pyruvyl transferase family protein [Rubrivivax sp.]